MGLPDWTPQQSNFNQAISLDGTVNAPLGFVSDIVNYVGSGVLQWLYIGSTDAQQDATDLLAIVIDDITLAPYDLGTMQGILGQNINAPYTYMQWVAGATFWIAFKTPIYFNKSIVIQYQPVVAGPVTITSVGYIGAYKS